MTPDPESIHSFKTERAFESWLRRNHAKETQIWVRLYKKGSGVPSITLAQALDVALCWGWIDGIRKSLDEHSYLQRYTPRRPKSIWSQINREHVARLTASGRMTPHGQRQVDAAKADGRWDAAYGPIRTTTVEQIPPDLRRAIDARPRARKALQALSRQELFALVFRTNALKTPAGRARKIPELVEWIERRADERERRTREREPGTRKRTRIPAKE